MIQAVRGLQWLSRLVGAVELTLGLVIWFVGVSSVTLHIGLGIVMTLILVIISGIALSTRGIRQLGIIGIVYAGILPALGMAQLAPMLLISNLHLLIQALHLLIGIGSIAVIHWIGGRYLSLQRAITQAASESAAVPQTSQFVTSDERG